MAPTRIFNFDTDFLDPAKLPPGTPVCGSPPVITAQPQDQDVISGDTTALTFAARSDDSSSVSYQWTFNGTNLPGETNASLVLTNVQTEQEGDYAAQVTSPFGSTASSNATVTVLAFSPTILVQPTNQNVLQGDTATLVVIAAGSLPLSYQWKFNGTNLPDATNDSLVLTDVQFAQAGDYTVEVANPDDSVLSSDALLTVSPVSYSATLGSFTLSSDGQPQFSVSGVSGVSYAILASTNLTDWEPLITNTSPFNFSDTNAVSFPQRFYRAVYQP